MDWDTDTEWDDFTELRINNTRNIEQNKFVQNDNMTMLEKLKNSAPYNVFFNKIEPSTQTQNDPGSISFAELLCPSLGVLKCSLQINFLVTIDWLIEQYKSRNLEHKPLTIIYGYQPFDLDEVENLEKNYPNVTHHFIEMEDSWSCHHSKIGIYVYEDNSLRVVVSSANLYSQDWNIFNQQLWVSPACPPLPPGSPEYSGESPTGFKASLLKYLKYYNLEILQPWMDHVRNADFSELKVFLVTSTPGNHPRQAPGSHLQQVSELLLRHCDLPARGALLWQIIAQASSMGTYGNSPDDWLGGHSGVLLKTLTGHTRLRPTSRLSPALSVIFPSVDDVTGGYFGEKGATCLSYRKEIHERQQWLNTLLCHWKADDLDRTRAMPHQKTYCRISPCLKKLAWFLLTSANVTKSGWGSGMRKNGEVYVRNYEAGVLFFPRFFKEEFFEIGAVENNKRVFPMMYDLPLKKYEEGDEPWSISDAESQFKR